LIHCLMSAGKIDLNYLARYTDAPLLVDDETGLFLRDSDGKTLVIDRATGELAPFDRKAVRPDPNARHPGHQTVLQLMAKRYLCPEYAPEAVADRCGIPAQRIRAIADEIARVAFEEEITLNRAWTDFRGE